MLDSFLGRSPSPKDSSINRYSNLLKCTQCGIHTYTFFFFNVSRFQPDMIFRLWICPSSVWLSVWASLSLYQYPLRELWATWKTGLLLFTGNFQTRFILRPRCLTLFQESCLKWKGMPELATEQEISCSLDYFWIADKLHCDSSFFSKTKVWILIIAFIICYVKDSLLCLNGRKVVNLFVPLRYYHESETFLMERE